MTSSDSFQIPLFDVPAAAGGGIQKRIAGVVFSFSRRSVFEQCLRRYFYAYFAAPMRRGGDAEAHLLKQLGTRYTRTGAILHRGIAWYLRRAQRGETTSVDGLTRWAQRIFTADREFSRAHPEGPAPTGEDYPPVLLREYHYRQREAEALCDSAEQRLINALKAFASGSVFAPFRLAGSSSAALLEQPIHLRMLPCRIDGQIDLAYPQANVAGIVDWKSGTWDGSGSDSLQIGVYALWAVEHFVCQPEDLRAAKAYLGSGDVVEYPVTPTGLDAVRARIIQDADRMASLERYGRSGDIDAFTPCAQPAVCSECPFLRICPEGSSVVDA